MKVQRTIPPTAAPLKIPDLFHGFIGLFFNKHYAHNLTEEMKSFFNVKHIFFTSTGKAALAVILAALRDMYHKDEVVIPAYTCFSVPSAIVKLGLKIKLCDINSSTLDFNYQSLDKAITKNTLCVIPSHLFGMPADMDQVNAICQAKGVVVVEDAAQAMGSFYKGKLLGTLGDAGLFSLGRGKNITCGSGGIILINADFLAEPVAHQYDLLEEQPAMAVLKEFLQLALMTLFISPALYWLPANLPFLKLGQTFFETHFPIHKLSRKKMGLLKHWQARLAEANRIRNQTSQYFQEQLQLPAQPQTAVPYLRLPIMVDSSSTKAQICALSQQAGLGISPMYPTAVHEIAEIKEHFFGMNFAEAKSVSERLVTLPTHTLLSEQDKLLICNLLKDKSRDEVGDLNVPMPPSPEHGQLDYVTWDSSER